jgi:undecaprenyl-diphosphatase
MDTSIYHALNNFAFEHKAVGDIAKFFAQYAVFLLVGAVAVAWLAVGREGFPISAQGRLAAFGAGIATILALLIVKVINTVWDRPRPFVVLHEFHKLIPHPADASFPSDHASGSFAIVGVLALAGKRTAAIAALIWAILIGVARVMVGVHWPSDIVGGIGVGLISALAVCAPRLQPYLDWANNLATSLYVRVLPPSLRPRSVPAAGGLGGRELPTGRPQFGRHR